MQPFIDIYHRLIDSYSLSGLCLLTAFTVLFFIQMWYYVRAYGRIPSYRLGRNAKPESGNTHPPVSVVVVMQDEFAYLEDTLPKLLGQRYPEFEVVAVDLASDEDFSNALTNLSERHPHLATTKIEKDPRFPVSYKMALNVGIKAARFERIITVSCSSYPTSDRWLELMARGFAHGDVVIGYCGVERKPGIVNKMIRCSRLMMSVRYLSSAIRGVPYRGITDNLGYTKSLYFGRKGFNYLNLNAGEDDLFIQEIATAQNTAVVMHPRAAVRQWQWSGIGWWRSVRRFRSYTYRYYPRRVKNYIQWELASRFFFFATAAAVAILMPWQVGAVVGGVVVLRLLVVEFEMFRIRKRLGEGGLGWIWIWYDLIAPASEFFLWIRRNIKSSSGLWR